MDRDGVFTRGELGSFEHLPLLAVRTVVDEEGTERIEECNDAFVRRLGRSAADLVGRPLRSIYESESPPTIGSRNEGRATRSDGGDTGDTGAPPDSGSDFDAATAASASETVRPSPSKGAAGSPAAPPDGSEPARADDPDWHLEEWVIRSGSDPAEHSLFGADGRLVHTLVDGIPRTDGSGRILVHVDITQRKRRERQADVLNRLMRHNVRNDLNLLRGHASRLAEHDDDEVATAAEVIDRIADRWLGLADKARQIERLFGDGPGETATLEHLTDEVRRSVQHDWPASTVRVSIDADPQLSVSERLCPAIVELCENGIKHTDSKEVAVSVSPAEAEGCVDVRIADHGPGIPEHERVALQAEEETPLQHGSGLGLWIVRFVVRQLGGDISVGDTDSDGGVIVLSVPIVDDGTDRTRD